MRKMSRLHFYRTHKYSSACCWCCLTRQSGIPPITITLNICQLFITAPTQKTQEYDSVPTADSCESAAFRMDFAVVRWHTISSHSMDGSKANKQNITKQKRLIYDRYSIMKSINRRVLYIHAQKKRLISIFRELVSPPLLRQQQQRTVNNQTCRLSRPQAKKDVKRARERERAVTRQLQQYQREQARIF